MKWFDHLPWRRPKSDVEAAKEAAREAHADWPRVRRIIGPALEHGARNGFGEKLVSAMGGREK